MAQHPDVKDLVPAEDSSSKKRRACESAEALWESVRQRSEALQPFVHQTLDKWHSKTSLSAKRMKKYKTLDLSVTKQVEQVMMDKQRIRQRTRTVRLCCVLMSL